MPLSQQALASETKFLSEMEKVQNVIRKKYRMLKLGRENMTETANEYLQPGITSLNKIVDKLSTSDNSENNKINVNKKNYNEEKNLITFDNTDIKTNSYNCNDNDVTITESTNKEEENVDEENEDKDINEYLDNYVKIINTLEWDKEYGERKINSQFKIGNSEVTFKNNKLDVANKTYDITDGFMQLLFMKKPNKTFITHDDEKTIVKLF